MPDQVTEQNASAELLLELSFKNVSYQYPKASHASLTNINLNVNRNKLIAVMGRTAAGKTTLLSTINGLIPHFSEGKFKGQVLVKGFNTQEMSIQKLVPYVGFVMQDAETQILGLTVEKDVAFGPCNLAYPRETIEKNVDFAIRTVQLDPYRHTSPDRLSGGEKQRLAIAGVLALESPILVLDEPTSELDPQGAESVYHTLLQLKQTRKHTILFSTHDSQFVIDKADELWVIDQGQIVYQGPPRDFFSDPDLPRQYSLEVPMISDLFRRLRADGIYTKSVLPTSLESAVEAIRSLLKNHIDPSPAVSLSSHSSQDPPPVKHQKVIDIQDLSYSYDTGWQAVKNVSVSFYEGEIVGIIGRNGAGKTTLLKHLNGLLKPTFGRVLVDGLDTRQASIEQLSSRVGYVFQNPDHQIFSSSVYEEIAFGLLNRGIDRVALDKRIQEALQHTALIGKEKVHPFNLSKGERQKLAIASVLAIKPQIIVIDEPTTGLDWEGSVAIMEEIVKLKEKGHTLILITHNTRLAAEYMERIIIMENGSIVRDGRANMVLSDLNFLRAHALLPPQISLLAEQLREYGVPSYVIKAEEMLEFIRNHLRGSVCS